ncbi:hypothetical protein ACHAW6_012482 [Cyclotella cf. meneghiniana]
MQGCPESPRLWEKHIDKILQWYNFILTTHEPCVYLGTNEGICVLFKHQVDDFAVSIPDKWVWLLFITVSVPISPRLWLLTWLPLGKNAKFVTKLYSAIGEPALKVQAALAKSHGFGYCKAIRELIWLVVMCRPDLSQVVVKCAQGSVCPSETHFKVVWIFFSYLAATIDDGSYFWCVRACVNLPNNPLPKIISTPHELLIDQHPSEEPTVLHGYMDSS